MTDAAPSLQTINLHLLPPQMRTIISVLGMALAYRLLKKRGGTRLRVPYEGEPWPAVAAIVGDEPAANLARVFRHKEFLVINKADKLIKQIRDQQIRAERGKTQNELAVQYDLTVRAIQMILAADEDGRADWQGQYREMRQKSLFDSPEAVSAGGLSMRPH